MSLKTFKFFLLVCIGFILSCTNDEEDNTIKDFAGFYKINSISSSLQIDLNNDGFKSNDYLQEIKSDYITFNGEVINYGYDNELIHNFAEARPTAVQTNTAQLLDIRFPIQEIDSIFQGNNNYVKMNMAYSKMYTGFVYDVTENTIEIKSDPLNHFEFYDIDNFQIDKVSTTEFETIFDFNVYDFVDNDWIKTRLRATYQKTED